MPTYARHHPEQSILYRTIQNHFETFIATAQQATDGRPFPLHVYKEVNAFLGCGILANGFIRVRCQSCGDEKLTPFSCKRRGFCPSCGGRRMNEISTHMDEAVFPNVAVRQWVVSFPFSVRYALAYNPALVTKVLSIFMRIVSNYYVKAARKKGINGKTGAITFIQRFGSQLQLNIHLHALFIDGVYTTDENEPSFFPVPPPTDDEIVTIVRRICQRVRRYLEKKGYELNDFSDDPFAHEQPVLSQILGASVQSRIGIGERAGLRVRRVGEGIRLDPAYSVGNRCAVCEGFSLHANTQILAHDRKALQKLIRYTARPPIALERMTEREDGKILYKLKNCYSDGTTHALFDPVELVEKVVALIPPARANLVRYSGIFASNSKIRSQIVPAVKAPKEGRRSSAPEKWADMLKRVFAIDILQCGKCGGKMQVIATIEDPAVVRKILNHLGLPSEAPRRASPRAPPQQSFGWEEPPPDSYSQIDPTFDSFE